MIDSAVVLASGTGSAGVLEWVTAVSTAAAAIAAAVSAIASWRSASKSSEAAVKATQALSRSILPTFAFELSGTPDPVGPPVVMQGLVLNESPFAAVDLHAQWHLVDGRIFTHVAPRIEGMMTSHDPASWRIQQDLHEHPAGMGAMEFGQMLAFVRVVYGDAERRAKWETTARPVWRHSRGVNPDFWDPRTRAL